MIAWAGWKRTDWTDRTYFNPADTLDAMSWAFQALRQEWNKDYTERRIIEAKAFDQSVVSFPANPATVVDSSRISSRMNEMQAILAEIRSA